MVDKKIIRPIYSELQGFLSQAPKKALHITVQQFWIQYNSTVDELTELAEEDYEKYRLVPLTYPDGEQYIVTSVYLQKLGGLIARLHGKYFSDEQVPFAEMPSTIIHQNQTQTQSVEIEFVLEVSNLINDKLQTAKDGSKEKTFLEKVRSSLGAVRNVSQLIPLIIKTANEMGISINELSDLF